MSRDLIARLIQRRAGALVQTGNRRFPNASMRTDHNAHQRTSTTHYRCRNPAEAAEINAFIAGFNLAVDWAIDQCAENAGLPTPRIPDDWKGGAPGAPRRGRAYPGKPPRSKSLSDLARLFKNNGGPAPGRPQSPFEPGPEESGDG